MAQFFFSKKCLTINSVNKFQLKTDRIYKSIQIYAFHEWDSNSLHNGRSILNNLINLLAVVNFMWGLRTSYYNFNARLIYGRAQERTNWRKV